MNVGFIGCGYVAEFYRKTLPHYPALNLIGVYDCNSANADRFAKRWATRKYESREQILNDRRIELVFNLTNPRSHYEVTRACLSAGKHVYSEKPLAMNALQALELAELAERNGLHLASAPCSVLGETAQTLGRALREGVIGKVRLVYANFDDGMIAPRMAPWEWLNESGVPWPAKDEFEVGCTYEHAGYVLTWLAAFFGPALRVTSFASKQIADKGIPVDGMAPDFAVGCIEYPEGIVARVTCGLVAPRDKSLTIIGDDGVLFVGNVRKDAAPVMVRPAHPPRLKSVIARRARWFGRWLEDRIAGAGVEAVLQHRYALIRKPSGHVVGPNKPVDFLLGPAEMVCAILENRPCRLSTQLGVHIVEIVEALQYPERFGFRKELTTTFPPVPALPWAN